MVSSSVQSTHSSVAFSKENSVGTPVLTSYRRRYSPSEKIWSILNDDSSFYNQLVIDFALLPADIKWDVVAQHVVDANPGCAIKPKSILGWQYWQSHGRAFPVRHKMINEDLSVALQTLPMTLNDGSGDVCDLWVLTHAQGVALVFRSTHAAMDGRGTFHWAEETLRAIRQEPLRGTNNTQSDLEFASDITTKQREAVSTTDCQPLTAGAVNNPQHFFAIRLNARASDLTPRLLISLRRYATAQGCDRFRSMIPTDLRSYKKNTCSTANLTGCLDVDIDKDATTDAVGLKLVMQLYKKMDAVFASAQHAMIWIPAFILRWITAGVVKRCAKANRYTHNANISNLGDIKPENVLLGDQLPRQLFFVAPYSRIFPLFICMTGFQTQSTITLAIPQHLQANAADLIDFLCAEFEGERLV